MLSARAITISVLWRNGYRCRPQLTQEVQQPVTVSCSYTRLLRRYSVTLRHLQDPFRVLGVSRGSSYRQVKEAFLKLALEFHPDRQGKNDNKKNSEEFIRIRKAFEVIKADSNGRAEATDEPQWSEEEFREFMVEQTSEFLSFRMDHDTRQEVIDTVDKLSPGGLDRGGTWLMARMLAERENCKEIEGGPPPKQLSARAQSSSDRVRRRKRR